MSSTVTAATTSTVAGMLFYGSLGLVLVITILFLLIKKEILLTSNTPLAVSIRRIVNVALVPLLVAFGFILVVNLVEMIA